MARIRMVTRTIKTTNAIVLMVDPETQETTNEIVEVAGVYEDNKTLIELIRDQMEGSGKIPVHVISSTVNVARYGMPESEYLKHAEIIDKEAAEESAEEVEA